MRRLLIISLMAALGLSLHAQRPIRLKVREPQAPDSIDLAYYGKEHPLRATLTVAGLNVSVWAYDHYIEKGDFSNISPHTVMENFRHGFIWDNDKLGTNMFLHPYHGNLYYNSARSNGFNYWQSGLFALGGSAMWELFMESEYPSTNDIIATPIGGMTIGEITFRASDAIIDDRSRGWERFGREAAVFAIDPMRGVTRIINGDAWRRRSTTGRMFGTPNVAMEISLGMRTLDLRAPVFDSGTGGVMQFNLEYGDRFEVAAQPHPYDYFTFNAELNLQRSQPLLGRINIVGRLLAKEFLEEKEQVLTVGMYQHFDFFDSDTISKAAPITPYKLGIPASVGGGVCYRDIQRNHFIFDAYLHINGVGMAGVLSDYYRVNERNYNLAAGFSAKAGVNIAFNRDRFSVAVGYKYYRLFSWEGYKKDIDWATINPRTLNVQGDHSAVTFAVGSIRADLRVSKRLYATAAASHYYRSTHYRDFAPVRSSTLGLSLMMTYKF